VKNSERVNFKMPLEIQKVCRKRKALLLEEKIKVLDHLRQGEKLGTVA
jgi:hypothetical protein